MSELLSEKVSDYYVSDFFYSCLGRSKKSDGFLDAFSGTISGIISDSTSGPYLVFFLAAFSEAWSDAIFGGCWALVILQLVGVLERFF